MNETIPETEKSTERISLFFTKSEKSKLMSIMAKEYENSGGESPSSLAAFMKNEIFTPWLKKQK